MAKELSNASLEEIRQAAASKGYRTDKKIAEVLGITASTYSRKIHGRMSFTLDEVYLFKTRLGMNATQLARIFLS